MAQENTLNPQQQVAACHVEGPMLVLAGAGSGKTRIVTQRVAHLLQLGIPASEILAVTFTNKAAGEMRERIYQLTHSAPITCTFHSLSARILRESIHVLGYKNDFVIFDEDDSEKVLKECLVTLNLQGEKGLLRDVRQKISQAKNGLLTQEVLAKEDQALAEIYALYQSRLKLYNALDFDDLLYLSVLLFKTHPEILEGYQRRWNFILIDEYQDTNAAQYELTKLLSAKHHNVFAVGDPDQSIYSWRGANIHNILNFQHDFPGAIILPLEQNYRSRPNILEAANALIQHNRGRYEKNLWSTRDPGEKIGLYIAESDRAETDFVSRKLRSLHEDQGIPFSQIVIFYRTNFQSRIFEDALLRDRVPYTIVGGLSFYQRREIKDLLCLLRVVLGGSDFLSFARTVNCPKRGLGKAALELLQKLSEEKQLDILTLCTFASEGSALSKKQREGLKEYAAVIASLKEMVRQNRPLPEILSEALERSRYVEFLKEDPETFKERRENLEELLSKAAEWHEEVEHPTLAAFLEELSLKSSSDEKGPEQDSVRLMTVHNGKGLEFSAVFLVGMEENLFPHLNTQESEESLEEERRLCYVAMTRAKDHLYLSASKYRFLWGAPRAMHPSRFLNEIPAQFLQMLSPKKASSTLSTPIHRFQ